MKRIYALPIALAVVIIVAALVFLMMNAETEAIGHNACDAGEPSYFDIRGIVTIDGQVEQRHFTEVSPSAIKVTFSDGSEVDYGQRIWIGDSIGSRAVLTRFNENGTVYRRTKQGGSWGNWESRRDTEEWPGGDSSSGSFCQWNREELTNLRRLSGSVSVGGVSTEHYAASREYGDDPSQPSQADLKLEWWVDGDGQLIKSVREQPGAKLKITLYYENIGEVNAIVAPMGTPTPPTTATPTPVATATCWNGTTWAGACSRRSTPTWHPRD